MKWYRVWFSLNVQVGDFPSDHFEGNITFQSDDELPEAKIRATDLVSNYALAFQKLHTKRAGVLDQADKTIEVSSKYTISKVRDVTQEVR